MSQITIARVISKSNTKLKASYDPKDITEGDVIIIVPITTYGTGNTKTTWVIFRNGFPVTQSNTLISFRSTQQVFIQDIKAATLSMVS